MNLEHFKHRLLEKEHELADNIVRLETEARGSEPEVGDAIEEATMSAG